MTVLLDNTVLSNFSTVRRPDLVRAAFVEQVGTTEQAFREMQDGIAVGKIPACDWDWLARVALTSVSGFSSRLSMNTWAWVKHRAWLWLGSGHTDWPPTTKMPGAWHDSWASHLQAQLAFWLFW